MKWTNVFLVTYLLLTGCATFKKPADPPRPVTQLSSVEIEQELFHLLGEAHLSGVNGRIVELRQAGIPLGNTFSAFLKLHGMGAAKDPKGAIPLLESSVSKGEPLAMSLLGRMYIDGKEVKQDSKRGLDLMTKASALGDPRSITYLGILYYTGTGVTRDYFKAREYFEKADALNDSYAPALLGQMYRYGRGVDVNPGEANRLFAKSARAGSSAGKVGYAVSYLRENSPAKALKQLGAPLQLGDVSAEALAGEICLRGGHRMRPDYPRAIALLNKAADQDDPRAQRSLGLAYERGWGVSRSRYTAAEWYFKAGLNDIKNDDRQSALTDLESLERVSGGSKLALELRSKIPGGVPSEAQGDAGSDSISSGTGWVIPEGFIVTANHVISGHKQLAVTLVGKPEQPVSLVISDAANDIAILSVKIPNSLPPGIPVSSAPAPLGAHVWTLGYPHTEILGVQQKVTDGIVSSTRGFQDDPRTYQVSVPVQAGNSGGPLLDMEGRAIGIVISKLSAVNVFRATGDLPEGVNYAVKADYLRLLVSQVRPQRPVRSVTTGSASLETLVKRSENSLAQVIAR